MSATVFKQVNYDVNALVKFIELGQIGLPDIQRPFVWNNVKVRDLFDSMYKGYPVGYLLFWQNAFSEAAKQIGIDHKQKVPNLLIVDGQQRLTSLYAVVKCVSVLRENFTTEQIEIAFDPLHEKFEVADAAIRRDKSYIPNISKVWTANGGLIKFVNTYLADLRETRVLTSEEEEHISDSITRLNGLLNFPLTALELSATVSEEDVADVFVRINSKGTPLNQADFILTLMSVFWDEGRAQLEDFCRKARQSGAGPSAYNHFIHPSPDQLLRAGIALGFKRARLNYVYSILRGKDLDTGEFTDQRRDEQFAILKAAQAKVLNLQYWQDFFKAIMQAGHRSRGTISSNTALIYSYALYLIGRTEYGVAEFDLRKVIARWFFMSSLRGRYTSSPESAMEFDLARLRDVKDAQGFVSTLNRVCDESLTSDYWNITLPNDLATSSAQSPSLYAFYAALVLLNAPVLFSNLKVSELLDPTVQANKSAIERHHLFPRGFLKKQGIEETRETNQIANYALVEWGDNVNISDSAPSDYLPTYTSRFGANELAKMYKFHALFDGWESTTYKDFLIRRRELIARVIQDGYESLKAGVPEAEQVISMGELVSRGETSDVEFKSTLRMNLHTGEFDQRIEHETLKTIGGFLNRSGGTLVLGVSDDGQPIGIEADRFPNEDKMHLHLLNLIQGRMGVQNLVYVHARFEDYDRTRVMAVECWPSKSPVFVKEGGVERFYVRTGVSTTELPGSKVQEYAAQRF